MTALGHATGSCLRRICLSPFVTLPFIIAHGHDFARDLSLTCKLHTTACAKACNLFIVMDSSFHIFDSEDDYRKHIVGDPKDTVYQIIISAVFGLGAFLAFCVCVPPIQNRVMFPNQAIRYCVLDGQDSMPPAKSRRIRPQRYRSFQTRYSDGSRRYGVSQRSRYWHHPAWMPLWYVGMDEILSCLLHANHVVLVFELLQDGHQIPRHNPLLRPRHHQTSPRPIPRDRSKKA